MSLCELQSESFSSAGCCLPSNKTQLQAGQPQCPVKLASVLFILGTSVVRTFLSIDGFFVFQVWRSGAGPVLGVQDSRTARLLTREGYDDYWSLLQSIGLKCGKLAGFRVWQLKEENPPNAKTTWHIFPAHRNFLIVIKQLFPEFWWIIVFLFDWITSNTHHIT